MVRTQGKNETIDIAVTRISFCVGGTSWIFPFFIWPACNCFRPRSSPPPPPIEYRLDPDLIRLELFGTEGGSITNTERKAIHKVYKEGKEERSIYNQGAQVGS